MRGKLTTSSKNCCVRCRMCLSSVSSRKFFFRASWLVLISFSSFSNFSNVACREEPSPSIQANSQFQRWKVHSWTQTRIETVVFVFMCLNFQDRKDFKRPITDYLQVDHISGKRDFWVLSSVHHWDVGLFDLLLNKPWPEEKLVNHSVIVFHSRKQNFGIFDFVPHLVSCPSPHISSLHSQTCAGTR